MGVFNQASGVTGTIFQVGDVKGDIIIGGETSPAITHEDDGDQGEEQSA